MMKLTTKVLAVVLAIFAAALLAGPVMAASPAQPAANIPANFACPAGGNLVVNVNYKVLNDVDSGTKGNFWAFDNYTKGILIWKYFDGRFCAVATYGGQFTTIAGDSPQAATTGGTVGAGVKGFFAGGWVSNVFHGTLQPNVQTHGSLGTKDFHCNADGTNCNKYYWLTVYFGATAADFVLANWGWVYVTPYNGYWINALSGNHGDISGSAH